ncbi:hypothetical protein TA3x_003724 [Tundrisphaera sp. TA3]|uniref:hypothetical protein n=1 Tax=Tundrisphaera sp. TA3 TaxID=3435775 RepID=UPI003EBCFFD4
MNSGLDRSLLPPDSPFLRITDWPSLIEQIRKCPGMWLGSASVSALSHFLYGIQMAEVLHDLPMEKRLGGFPADEFEEWVADHFNPERLVVRSFHLALLASDSEMAGFRTWLDWYDRFRQARAGS